MIRKLTLPKGGRVTHLVHLSDIHIRAGDPEKSRARDYELAFQGLLRLVRSLACAKRRTVAFLVTGDIFHNKGRIESAGVELFRKLMSGMEGIGPVYVLQGNHDFRQDQPDAPGMLTAFLGPFTEGARTCHLDRTGFYVAGDLGVGLLDVRDTVSVGSTARDGAIDPGLFPPADGLPSSCATKIAVFHGPVRGCATNMGEYSLDATVAFRGYDVAMLGDVHVPHAAHVRPSHDRWFDWSRGEGDAPTPWAYAGSLVQQSFGEDVSGHGFLLWDLVGRRATHVEVSGATWMLTVDRSSTGVLRVRHLHANAHGAVSPSPTVAYLRSALGPPETCIVRSAEPKAAAEFVRSAFELKGVVRTADLPVASEARTPKSSATKTDLPPTLEQFLAARDETWLAGVLSGTLDLLVPIRDAMVPKEVRTRLAERNAKILRATEDALVSSRAERAERPWFRIRELHWSWMMCYGPDNRLVLEDGITSIRARNGAGKSSAFDILLYALFGDTAAPRVGPSAGLVNVRKPAEAEARTVVEVDVGSDSFRVERSIFTGSGRRSASSARVVRVRDGLAIFSGKTAVQAWVTGAFGGADGFLRACMLTQDADGDMLSMTPAQQTAIIDSALGLQSTESLKAALRGAELAHAYLAEHLQTFHSEHDPEADPEGPNADALDLELGQLDRELASFPPRSLMEARAATRSENEVDVDATTEITAPELGNPSSWLFRHEDALRFASEPAPQVPCDADRDRGRIERVQGILRKIGRGAEDGPVVDPGITLEEAVDDLEQAAVVVVEAQARMQIASSRVGDVPRGLPASETVRKNLRDAEKARSAAEQLFPGPQAALRVAAEREARLCSQRESQLRQTALRTAEDAASLREVLRVQSRTPVPPAAAVLAAAADRAWRLARLRCEQLEKVRKDTRFRIYRLEAACHEARSILRRWSLRRRRVLGCLQRWLRRREEPVTVEEALRWVQDRQGLQSTQAALATAEDADRAAQVAMREFVTWCEDRGIRTDPRVQASHAERVDGRASEAWRIVTTARATDTDIAKQRQVLEACERSEAAAEELVRAAEDVARAVSDEKAATARVRAAARRDLEASERSLASALSPLARACLAAHAAHAKAQLERFDSILDRRGEVETARKTAARRSRGAAYAEEVLDRGRKIGRAADLLAEYRAWLYKDFVIPGILRHANVAVAAMSSEDLSMRCDVSDNADRLDWIVRTCSSGASVEVPIRKASGFQRFACGLGLRIGMVAMGMYRCEQIFLDEGFVACDARNLARVPGFLSDLRRLFRSVLVVSHLEEVQDAADRAVLISSGPYGSAIGDAKN